MQIQADSVFSGTNGFINFLTSVHGDKRRETQFLKVYVNHMMLNPPQRTVPFVMFKISVIRDPKNPTPSFNGQNPTLVSTAEDPNLASLVQSQLTSFQNPQILRTIFSEHDVIHTPAPFPFWSLL